MAGANELISIKVDDRELRRVFDKIALIDDNMEPLFSDIGEHLLNSTLQRFEDQVDPDGVPWAALDPKTIDRKKKNADKILIEYGDLMNDAHYNVGPSSVEFGFNKIYAATHQFGDEERSIEARPILGTSAEDDEIILDLAESYLLKLLQSV